MSIKQVLMKKWFIVLATVLFLLSCDGNMDKIDRFMFENLYDYDSYQVIDSSELYGKYVHVKFRCKTAGGISSINEWQFVFNDDGEIETVYDENEENALKRCIYRKD